MKTNNFSGILRNFTFSRQKIDHKNSQPQKDIDVCEYELKEGKKILIKSVDITNDLVKNNKPNQLTGSDNFGKESFCGSEKQMEFMAQHRKHHRQIVFSRIFIFVLFLLLWEYSTRQNWIDSFFFSSPSRVVLQILTLFQNHQIFLHVGITLLETLVSFLLVFFVSLLFSTLLWYSKRLSEIMEPYLVVLNSLPKSALAPLFIVWLGTGTTTIIVAGISVALFGSIISFYTGFQQCDPEKITLIYTLGGNKKDAFTKVVLPGSVPILISTMKVNIGLALVGVIIGEFLAAKRGLGYLIIYGSQVFQLDLVITSIILLCMIAIGFYQGIQAAERKMREKIF